ncbi:hypothetical protein BD414DRAFT_9332 [Trametes punicea]|nr:hypothetical protein BD414DRAFT_9332 [Trametes punicea]
MCLLLSSRQWGRPSRGAQHVIVSDCVAREAELHRLQAVLFEYTITCVVDATASVAAAQRGPRLRFTSHVRCSLTSVKWRIALQRNSRSLCGGAFVHRLSMTADCGRTHPRGGRRPRSAQHEVEKRYRCRYLLSGPMHHPHLPLLTAELHGAVRAMGARHLSWRPGVWLGLLGGDSESRDDEQRNLPTGLSRSVVFEMAVSRRSMLPERPFVMASDTSRTPAVFTLLVLISVDHCSICTKSARSARASSSSSSFRAGASSTDVTHP